jgi:hypothetical protein
VSRPSSSTRNESRVTCCKTLLNNLYALLVHADSTTRTSMLMHVLIDVVDRSQVDTMLAVPNRLIVTNTVSMLDRQATTAGSGWEGHGHYWSS